MRRITFRYQDNGITALTVIILLMAMVFISTVVAALITNSDSVTLSEEDMQQLVDGTLQDLTSYITIGDVIGRFEGDSDQEIHKIAFLLKPLFSQNIDISTFTMRFDTNNALFFYRFNNSVQRFGSTGLFSHPLWANLSEGTFGIVIINDDDNSVEQYNIFNDRSDMVYLVMNLSNEQSLSYGESVDVTLLQTSGLHKTLTLHTPLPMKKVVTLARGFY
jgi:archaellin